MGKQIGIRALRGIDRLVNLGIILILALTGLYGGLGLWDVLNIYHKAGVSAEVMGYKPDGGNGLSFSELRAVNPDVAAWIEIPDTPIDFPVLQGESNMEYINRDVSGDFSLAGSIFWIIGIAPTSATPTVLFTGIIWKRTRCLVLCPSSVNRNILRSTVQGSCCVQV
ncbi:hypothetical protein RQN30_07550 [Arcanobacterium hippocoleae]